MEKQTGKRLSRAERRRIQDILVGFGVICLLVGGGVWLKVSANQKVSRKEQECLALFARGLGGKGDPSAVEALDQAGACYGELLRAKPLFSQMGFRAQAATDVAAYLQNESSRATPAEALANETFREGFEAFAAGDLPGAAAAFDHLTEQPGSIGKLAVQYRRLIAELMQIAR